MPEKNYSGSSTFCPLLLRKSFTAQKLCSPRIIQLQRPQNPSEDSDGEKLIAMNTNENVEQVELILLTTRLLDEMSKWEF